MRSVGCGPSGAARVTEPFASATRIASPSTATAVGYRPTGREPVDARPLAPGVDHGEVVVVGIRDEHAPVRRAGERGGSRAFESVRPERHRRIPERLPGPRVESRHPVVGGAGHEEPVLRRVEEERGRMGAGGPCRRGSARPDRNRGNRSVRPVERRRGPREGRGEFRTAPSPSDLPLELPRPKVEPGNPPRVVLGRIQAPPRLVERDAGDHPGRREPVGFSLGPTALPLFEDPDDAVRPAGGVQRLSVADAARPSQAFGIRIRRRAPLESSTTSIPSSA